MKNMTNKTSDNTNLLTIRWIARIIGTLFALFCILYLSSDLAEVLRPTQGIPPQPWDFFKIALAISFLSSIAGLILAFWKEGIGGLIAFAGMALSLVLMKFNPDANFNFTIFILLIPSLLYLLYWFLARKSSVKQVKTRRK
jgi:hypothetical protein